MNIFPILPALVVVGIAATVPFFLKFSYFYFAAYIVLQYVVLATAWNILGGYAGYVNFGVSAFFGIGAYISAYLFLTYGVNPLVGMLAGGAAAAALGGALGYATLRLRGVFFAIATIGVAVVLLYTVLNTPELGGSVGLYIFPPDPPPPYVAYREFLFVVMAGLAVLAILIAYFIEHSRIGKGLTAIKDDELAAESMGVPIFKLKVLDTTLSGFLMGLAGAPFPFYITYMEPLSTFSLDITVNSIAMSLIGGTSSWVGPLIGAFLLGTIQQIVTVTISSEINLLIMGVLILAFVIGAPSGVLGLIYRAIKR